MLRRCNVGLLLMESVQCGLRVACDWIVGRRAKAPSMVLVMVWRAYRRSTTRTKERISFLGAG
jgi:hypothetical protein